MLKILFDHDFNREIETALGHRLPNLDALTARQARIHELHDRLVLRWANSSGRVLISRDLRTMPRHFADLLVSGEMSSGILTVPSGVRFRQAVDDIARFIVMSGHDEWINRLHILSTRG